MKINSNINILGSLPDWNLIQIFLREDLNNNIKIAGGVHSHTSIKTDKSIKRFESAIRDVFLTYKNQNVKYIIQDHIHKNGINNDTLLMLYWNASINNDLIKYLNKEVFFPAFYSGRVSLKKDEIEACINDLKETNQDLKGWTNQTIKTTARKYLTLLKKFGLMEGSVNKSIVHPHLERCYVCSVCLLDYCYLRQAQSCKQQSWLPYCFSEKQAFLDRLLQKKFSKYFNVVYTGDKLSIEPLIPYESIYEHITKS
jgi:hypothetical protein